MPDTAWPIGRHSPSSSRTPQTDPLLMSSKSFRHFIHGLLSFAFIGSYLTRSMARLFPQRFPPRLFTAAVCGWFVASACTATTEGHRTNSRPAPPSLARHRIENTGHFFNPWPFRARGALCDASSGVPRPHGQEIVSRDINGSEQQVEVGVHRGPLRVGGWLLSTADFDHAAYKPSKTTAPAMESII